MEIRYITWAGYDLLGSVIITRPGAPSMESNYLSYDVKAEDYEYTRTISANEILPSVKSEISSTRTSVSATNKDLRPFPRPS